MPVDTMTSEPTLSCYEPQSLQAPGDDVDSLSTLSDNLSIWIDGEEHWISGVDASTTCADLICALISYQTVHTDKQMFRKEGLALRTQQEFAIVQKQQHYEEYLDGNARLFDVITSRHALPSEESQLQLRHLASSTRKHTPTTDADSGMGSPVDSSRSMRFRRRGKHKVLPSAKTTDNSHSKQPKRSRKLQQRNYHMTPNESLLNIILAQDETILQQMSMLHEKDRQILKIEVEKHRVRERELGKNYLLETYLKDLDEPQENSPDPEEFEEGIVRLLEDGNDGIRTDEDCKTSNDGDTVKDETRLYWLEKIHTVNKQLQREEELLLSLHAKVRRHQVKRAYQTKSEVLLQIDRLDTELAAQVEDIHRVERKLFTANEQLKAKLGVLECLGREFETTVTGSGREADTAVDCEETAGGDPCPPPKNQADELCDSGPPIFWRFRDQHNCRLTQQGLTERNLKARQISNKELSKQMFIVSGSANPATATSVPKEEFGLKNAFAVVSEMDLQHLGTLV
ncbi:ras association domain-containing protein 10 [Drosophila elegans]|uniref:ras association domain-containing protein 10 n=1 Tax=Drosophila elegans TaxID=30023 RepID=UPI0007E8640D|nr:ras association domain-containing protein 10 [Drosophila elegans]XP_017127399.1 ras association domain-containing protein 10 [Drosophila elegans]XP_017127400.1 ras association domain-containing protein 10 [Drosophila elegans]XP_017127402.1 ras association domain-containing protein 10 [Drosophila elegans]XP_041563802.1 ras association domain-containing protein 10 [Drosophila elegans]